jgi:hypothetical protein
MAFGLHCCPADDVNFGFSVSRTFGWFCWLWFWALLIASLRLLVTH